MPWIVAIIGEAGCQLMTIHELKKEAEKMAQALSTKFRAFHWEVKEPKNKGEYMLLKCIYLTLHLRFCYITLCKTLICL